MSMFMTLAAALALLVQFALWMVWRNLMIWHPVDAHLSGHDYNQSKQERDNAFRVPVGPLTVDLMGPQDDARITECWYRYCDEDGETHTVSLTDLVTRGYNPEASIMLWYDPANPDRCTRFGPGTWLLVLVASAASLAALIWYAPKIIPL